MLRGEGGRRSKVMGNCVKLEDVKLASEAAEVMTSRVRVLMAACRCDMHL